MSQVREQWTTPNVFRLHHKVPVISGHCQKLPICDRGDAQRQNNHTAGTIHPPCIQQTTKIHY